VDESPQGIRTDSKARDEDEWEKRKKSRQLTVMRTTAKWSKQTADEERAGNVTVVREMRSSWVADYWPCG
jgi:hypothetical protein